MHATPQACHSYKKASRGSHRVALPYYQKMIRTLAEGRHGTAIGRTTADHFGYKPVWSHRAGKYRMFYTMEGGRPLLLGFYPRSDSRVFTSET